MTATTIEHISLPGQAHVANGPHAQTGMYLMHHAFRRDLARFEASVRATPIGAADTWAALAHRWTRYGEILHHHHSVEDDALWPVLTAHAERLGDETAMRMLEDMEAEHAVIDPALTACTDGFAAMREHPCADHRNALDVTSRTRRVRHCPSSSRSCRSRRTSVSRPRRRRRTHRGSWASWCRGSPTASRAMSRSGCSPRRGGRSSSC